MSCISYDFKMFMGNSKNILCFNAHINNNALPNPTIDIIEVEGFGINDTYKDLFYSIVQGKLTFNLMEKRPVKYPKIKTVKINNGSIIKNLKKFEKYSKIYFGITVEITKYKHNR